jgi:hypothetical protein
MSEWIVEMRGDVRELYSVTADTREEAEANWHNGSLVVSEASSMEVYDVREDD